MRDIGCRPPTLGRVTVGGWPSRLGLVGWCWVGGRGGDVGEGSLGLLLSVGTLGKGTVVGVGCSGRGLGAGGLLLSVGWSLRKVVALVGVSVCGGGVPAGCPGWMVVPCPGVGCGRRRGWSWVPSRGACVFPCVLPGPGGWWGWLPGCRPRGGGFPACACVPVCVPRSWRLPSVGEGVVLGGWAGPCVR